MSEGGGGGRLHSIPLDILDDLASRFIINAPEGEKEDLIRVCFQVRDGGGGRNPISHVPFVSSVHT